MNQTETLLGIPDETSRALEGPGRKLETAVIVNKCSTFMVLSYRVDYSNRQPFRNQPTLVKFSQREHAIPVASQIWLRTSMYYRELEDNGLGIADVEEARFVEIGTMDDFCKRHGVPNFQGSEAVSSEVTWQISDFWMFCTSLMPGTSRDFKNLQKQFPDKEYPTVIPNPSAFALQIGKDFGSQTSVDDVQFSGLDALRLRAFPCKLDGKVTSPGTSNRQEAIELSELPQKIDMVVFVHHGPVVYTDQPVHLLECFPESQHSTVVPFIKRKKYENQREYRFTMGIGGNPKSKTFKLDISNELRCLTHLRSDHR